MIFQRGHSVKAVKEVSLFLNIGYTTAKKRPKIFVIIIKTKNRIEYHKNDVEMQEMPLERNQNLQNFMVSWGTISPGPPIGLSLMNFCERLYGAKRYFPFLQKGLESLYM